MEIDERAFDTIDSVNCRWVDKVTKRKEMGEDCGIGEKSDGVLTSEEVRALLEQHTRQLEERVHLLEAKSVAP